MSKVQGNRSYLLVRLALLAVFQVLKLFEKKRNINGNCAIFLATTGTCRQQKPTPAQQGVHVIQQSTLPPPPLPLFVHFYQQHCKLRDAVISGVARLVSDGIDCLGLKSQS